MLNQQIHNYKIISLLGEGGIANVYLVEHLTLGQKYAFKLLKDEFVQHPNIRKRFLAEARNLAKMQHPNIIKVTDLIDAGDIVAFVMENIEGVSLEQYISDNSPLSHETIEKLFLQMIDAVEYVHSQGLIHRDIKPSNFMVTPDESVKLLDFGIAKNLNDGAVDYTKTSMAQQMGTPMYMSPEQVRNTSEITPQTDIYSLGVVLWQMVMNKKPYDADALTLPEIQVGIMKEPLPLTNTGWDDVIKSTTSKDIYGRSDFDEIRELASYAKFNDLLSKQESKALAEVVYEKELIEIQKVADEVAVNREEREKKMQLFAITQNKKLKEIEKVADEMARNREEREKKMQAKSTALTTKINQKYVWIGIIFLIAFFAFIYWNQNSTFSPVQKRAINDKVNDSKGIDDNIKKQKVTIDKTDELTSKSDQNIKQKEKVIEKSIKLKVGQKHQGGIIFYIDNTGEHGLVCMTIDQGKYNWDEAMSICEKLNMNGYSDWYLPSSDELRKMADNSKLISGIVCGRYWSSTVWRDFPSLQSLSHENCSEYVSSGSGYKYEICNVRSIRKF